MCQSLDQLAGPFRYLGYLVEENTFYEWSRKSTDSIKRLTTAVVAKPN